MRVLPMREAQHSYRWTPKQLCPRRTQNSSRTTEVTTARPKNPKWIMKHDQPCESPAHWTVRKEVYLPYTCSRLQRMHHVALHHAALRCNKLHLPSESCARSNPSASYTAMRPRIRKKTSLPMSARRQPLRMAIARTLPAQMRTSPSVVRFALPGADGEPSGRMSAGGKRLIRIYAYHVYVCMYI